MKTWFITGCSTGFGRSLATAVLDHGDRAVVTARDVEQVKDIAEDRDGRTVVLPLDVTDPEQVRHAVRESEDRFGGIDVLVNNAGVGYFAAVEESDDAEIRRLFEINFFGLSDLIRSALPGMRRRGGGTIVNFSSIGGLCALPGLGYYNATKFAVEGLSEALWQEVEPLGIRVLLVEPGPFRTDWAGRSAREPSLAREIADYAPTAGARRAAFRAHSGREPGDPARAARAIIQAVESDDPPHRLLLGGPAYAMAMEKLERLRAEFTAWEPVTRAADFPQ